MAFQNEYESPLKLLQRRGSLDHMKKKGNEDAKNGCSYYKSQFGSILHFIFHFYIMYCQAVLIRAQSRESYWD